MPEKVGLATGLIKKKDGTVFGLNIDGSEYLYSFPQYRGEPFEDDKVEVGCDIRVEYQDTADKAGKTKSYISVLEVRGWDEPVPGTPQPPPAAREWGYEQKDRLMCRESCAKSAVAIFAASIQAGIYKTHPEVSVVTVYAGALESWCLEAVGHSAEPEFEPDDEVPFE